MTIIVWIRNLPIIRYFIRQRKKKKNRDNWYKKNTIKK